MLILYDKQFARRNCQAMGNGTPDERAFFFLLLAPHVDTCTVHVGQSQQVMDGVERHALHPLRVHGRRTVFCRMSGRVSFRSDNRYDFRFIGTSFV